MSVTSPESPPTSTAQPRDADPSAPRPRNTGLARGLTFLLGGHAASLALTFVTNLVTTRALGPAGRGEFASVTATAAALVLPLSLGIGAAAPIFVGRRPDTARATTILGVIIGCTVLVCLLVWDAVRSTSISAFLTGTSLNLILVFSIVAQISSGALYGLGHIAELAGLNLLLCFVSSAFQVAGVILGFRATGLLLCTAAANVLCSGFYVRAVCRHTSSGTTVLDTARLAIPMGIRAGASSWQQQLLQRGSVLWMVALGWPVTDIGITSVAASIAEIGAIIPTHLAGITRSRVAQGFSTHRERLVTNLLAIGAVLSYTAVLLIGGPRIFVLMFGTGFESAWQLCLVILAGAVVSSAATGRISHAQGSLAFPSSLLVSGFVAMLLGILLALPLSRSFGVFGVVVASAITNGLYVLLALFVTRTAGRPPARLHPGNGG